MAKDRSLVRASDIGQWTFCHRAWWLANVRKVEHGNPQVLQQGTDRHDAHGRQVLTAMQMRRAGMFLLLLALLLLALFVLIQLLVG